MKFEADLSDSQYENMANKINATIETKLSSSTHLTGCIVDHIDLTDSLSEKGSVTGNDADHSDIESVDNSQYYTAEKELLQPKQVCKPTNSSEIISPTVQSDSNDEYNEKNKNEGKITNGLIITDQLPENKEINEPGDKSNVIENESKMEIEENEKSHITENSSDTSLESFCPTNVLYSDHSKNIDDTNHNIELSNVSHKELQIGKENDQECPTVNTCTASIIDKEVDRETLSNNIKGETSLSFTNNKEVVNVSNLEEKAIIVTGSQQKNKKQKIQKTNTEKQKRFKRIKMYESSDSEEKELNTNNSVISKIEDKQKLVVVLDRMNIEKYYPNELIQSHKSNHMTPNLNQNMIQSVLATNNQIREVNNMHSYNNTSDFNDTGISKKQRTLNNSRKLYNIDDLSHINVLLKENNEYSNHEEHAVMKPNLSQNIDKNISLLRDKNFNVDDSLMKNKHQEKPIKPNSKGALQEIDKNSFLVQNRNYGGKIRQNEICDAINKKLKLSVKSKLCNSKYTKRADENLYNEKKKDNLDSSSVINAVTCNMLEASKSLENITRKPKRQTNNYKKSLDFKKVNNEKSNQKQFDTTLKPCDKKDRTNNKLSENNLSKELKTVDDKNKLIKNIPTSSSSSLPELNIEIENHMNRQQEDVIFTDSSLTSEKTDVNANKQRSKIDIISNVLINQAEEGKENDISYEDVEKIRQFIEDTNVAEGNCRLDEIPFNDTAASNITDNMNKLPKQNRKRKPTDKVLETIQEVRSLKYNKSDVNMNVAFIPKDVSARTEISTKDKEDNEKILINITEQWAQGSHNIIKGIMSHFQGPISASVIPHYEFLSTLDNCISDFITSLKDNNNKRKNENYSNAFQ